MKNQIIACFFGIVSLCLLACSLKAQIVSSGNLNNNIGSSNKGYCYKNGIHYLVWTNGYLRSDGATTLSDYDGYIKLSTSSDGLNWTTQNLFFAGANGAVSPILFIDSLNFMHIAYCQAGGVGYQGSGLGDATLPVFVVF